MSNTFYFEAELRDALVSRGHSDAAIAALSPEEKVDEYCEWIGLTHYGPSLRAIYAVSGLTEDKPRGNDLAHAKADLHDALLNRGHSDASIATLTPAEMFDEYCQWHGLIGYGPTLRAIHNAAGFTHSRDKKLEIGYGR